MDGDACIVWGAELSPYLLKLEALLRAAGVAFRRLPRDAGRLGNLRCAVLVERAKRRGTALRPPANDVLDEYPLVPYLITPQGEVLYDSSALAYWLHDRRPEAGLIPEDPALAFLARLIDEAFDEFGLYMVHHNRWKLAARNNDDPGGRLVQEYARHRPPGVGRPMAAWFARRQVRRLPYLFSVAPKGYSESNLAPALTPPSRRGFPPTHRLLEQAWELYLSALEALLARQPFLFGPRFTLADASAYGQLSMNLTDTAAAERLAALAPITTRWLQDIRAGKHVGSAGSLEAAPELAPLLAAITATFVPLMQANEAAYLRRRAAGATLFNEKAFDAGVNLYDGELLGHPYRTVVKTFQVRVWRELCAAWKALPADAKASISPLLSGRDGGRLFRSAAPA